MLVGLRGVPKLLLSVILPSATPITITRLSLLSDWVYHCDSSIPVRSPTPTRPPERPIHNQWSRAINNPSLCLSRCGTNTNEQHQRDEQPHKQAFNFIGFHMNTTFHLLSF